MKVWLSEFAKAGEDDDPGPDDLSIIDIQAAIAKQGIPISQLYNKQDLAANRDVMGLIHEAESRIQGKLEKEIVVLNDRTTKLQAYRNKAETIALVEGSPSLTDKPAKVIADEL